MNDNFTFYLNNFQNIEKDFRKILKDKLETNNFDDEKFKVINYINYL